MNTDLLPRDGLVLCAVSGGIDSMYLLCWLMESGYSVAAAHYNHGLRDGEADRDESFVRSFCETRQIPLKVGRGDVKSFAAEKHIGLEEAARILRYAFLETAADEFGAVCIATAHTADDNAETVLMNLVRGAGLKGLSGIPPIRGRIVRPILDITRKEAEAWLEVRGIGHVEDSTNADDDYTRNRIRHNIIPLLLKENPAFPAAVSRMVSSLRTDEAYLSGLARSFVEENSDGGSLDAAAFSALPEAVARRVVRIMTGTSLEEKHVRGILRTAARGGVIDIPGMRVAQSENRLVFGVPDREAIQDRLLPSQGFLELPEIGGWVQSMIIDRVPSDVYKSLNTFYFKYENIYGNITITSRRPGDSYRPAGRNCRKSLKSLFMEAGIPLWDRGTIPVIRDERGILGVCGFPAAEHAAALPGDSGALKIEFFRRNPEREE